MGTFNGKRCFCASSVIKPTSALLEVAANIAAVLLRAMWFLFLLLRDAHSGRPNRLEAFPVCRFSGRIEEVVLQTAGKMANR